MPYFFSYLVVTKVINNEENNIGRVLVVVLPGQCGSKKREKDGECRLPIQLQLHLAAKYGNKTVKNTQKIGRATAPTD